jgi:hypothetical protein
LRSRLGVAVPLPSIVISIDFSSFGSTAVILTRAKNVMVHWRIRMFHRTDRGQLGDKGPVPVTPAKAGVRSRVPGFRLLPTGAKLRQFYHFG